MGESLKGPKYIVKWGVKTARTGRGADDDEEGVIKLARRRKVRSRDSKDWKSEHGWRLSAHGRKKTGTVQGDVTWLAH